MNLELTRRAVAVLAAIVTGVLPFAIANPATAAEPAPQPFACSDMGWHYRTFSRQDLHIGLGIHFKSGPGGTVSASIQKSLSTTVGVSMSTTFSASAIVSSAEATFGINASVTASIAQTFNFSRNISANNKYGNLRFGNWGWSMGVEKYYLDNNCKQTQKFTGTVTRMPSANSWGYRYWETTS